MNKLYLLLIMAICLEGCTSNTQSEIHQSDRSNVFDVRQNVHEIPMDEVLIGSIARLFLLNDYLIIADCKSVDEQIRLFDNRDFSYVFSVAPFGEGPDEITNMGNIVTNETKNEFYVSDHAKQKIFCYNMDSLLIDSMCPPTIKARMDELEFPSNYHYFNDTLSIGVFIRPTGVSGYNQVIARWNMKTGMVTPMSYEHPQIEKKRVSMDVSEQYDIYVEGYLYHDLLTICKTDGSLVCNIYGPDWNDKRSNKKSYYRKVAFYNDKIVALQSGQDTFYNDKMNGTRSLLPTKFLIFDIQGNYIKTLDVGYRISDFCCDTKNERLIMNFDDDIQFGYLELKGII